MTSYRVLASHVLLNCQVLPDPEFVRLSFKWCLRGMT